MARNALCLSALQVVASEASRAVSDTFRNFTFDGGSSSFLDGDSPLRSYSGHLAASYRSQNEC